MRAIITYIFIVFLHFNGFSQKVNFFNINNSEYSDNIELAKDFNRIIGIPENIQIQDKPYQTLDDQIGFSHEKFKLEYNQIPIEFSTVIVHKKDNSIQSITGEYFEGLDNLDNKILFDAENCFEFALKHINAEIYIWETEKAVMPKGELIYIANYVNKKDKKVHLAYKFEIIAIKPFIKKTVYISTHTGKILLENSLILYANGTADTRYSGQRNISTKALNNNSFELRDETRGSDIGTFNSTTGTIFTNGGNNWTAAVWDNAAKDNAALDVHWGMMMSYDYFKNVHSWNSYDGNDAFIRSQVHYGGNNSFYDFTNNRFLFGDGGVSNDPWTSLDVVAHEFGHGVEYTTAVLLASGEPGGINESFSDIWGACVENYVSPSRDIWNIGEHFHSPNPLRSMSDPKSLDSPDTYGGDYWFLSPTSTSINRPHYINGVSNHWFYLLSIGGNDVNDNIEQYDVYGISISKAEKIAFRALTNYFTPNTNYHQARSLTIQAAIDLYGECSQEVVSTTNAWHAVGVGDYFQKEYNLFISNYIQPNTHEIFAASNNIVASSLIGNNSNINLLAGNSINLKPGFHTRNTFLARIEMCENLEFGDFSSKKEHQDIIQTRVTETSKKNNVSIYPNPTNSTFTIQMEDPLNYSFSLYTLTGEKLMTRSILNSKTKVDIQPLPSGVYYLEIRSENINTYLKIIKQ